jgi:hypothetical protein
LPLKDGGHNGLKRVHGHLLRGQTPCSGARAADEQWYGDTATSARLRWKTYSSLSSLAGPGPPSASRATQMVHVGGLVRRGPLDVSLTSRSIAPATDGAGGPTDARVRGARGRSGSGRHEVGAAPRYSPTRWTRIEVSPLTAGIGRRRRRRGRVPCTRQEAPVRRASPAGSAIRARRDRRPRSASRPARLPA